MSATLPPNRDDSDQVLFLILAIVFVASAIALQALGFK